ncbi:MAG: type II toxin-antitoxin system prevent-host-death family antitoxin [Anaerolineales bacterium]|nr:type II toxin-antitoxin system prevent-host-death family antitoxin [Anaerolineales bacterium]
MREIREVSSRDAREKWRDILDSIMKGDGDVAISRYGKPIAVLIPAKDYREIAEELDELRLARLAEDIYEGYLERQEVAESYDDVRVALLQE